MFRLIALISGFLFGAGMIVSGMSDPANVMAFLDIFGQWSPDLAFVMGGALLVFAPSYWLVIRRKAEPVCTDQFCISENNKIDAQLLSGSALFGLGWVLLVSAQVQPFPLSPTATWGLLALYLRCW
ncbi:predicted transporter component [Vibrio maritimus]|uniref:Predicted transporter component n=1 Tax=Vibrio maritimus TaxID=990268 RepID=A0A090SZM7_9VIBR|nr:predicted transporter component [Vibrio maritimus]